MTRQKLLVLDMINKSDKHPSAEQVYLEVRKLDDKISRSTVYRNLSVLVTQDMITKVKLAKVDHFEPKQVNHHHLVCLNCGVITDMNITYDHNIDKEVATKSGYDIKKHRIVFEGLCSKCQKQ